MNNKLNATVNPYNKEGIRADINNFPEKDIPLLKSAIRGYEKNRYVTKGCLERILASGNELLIHMLTNTSKKDFLEIGEEILKNKNMNKTKLDFDVKALDRKGNVIEVNEHSNLEDVEKVSVEYKSSDRSSAILLDVEKGLERYFVKYKDKISLVGSVVTINNIDSPIFETYESCFSGIGSTWRDIGIATDDKLYIVNQIGYMVALSRTNNINGAIGWIGKECLNGNFSLIDKFNEGESESPTKLDVENNILELEKQLASKREYLKWMKKVEITENKKVVEDSKDKLVDELKNKDDQESVENSYYIDIEIPNIEIIPIFDEFGKCIVGDNSFVIDKQTKVMQEQIGDEAIVLIKTSIKSDKLENILNNRDTFQLLLTRDSMDKNGDKKNSLINGYSMMKLVREYESRMFNNDNRYYETTYIFASEGVQDVDIRNIMDRDLREQEMDNKYNVNVAEKLSDILTLKSKSEDDTVDVTKPKDINPEWCEYVSENIELFRRCLDIYLEKPKYEKITFNGKTY